MAQENTNKKPEVIVFAGPNGSGKSTVTTLAAIIAPYINADEIRRTIHCTDIEATQKAEWLRNQSIDRFQSFTFETVMSTRRNLDLLIKAKQAGYFIRCIYVLTANPAINLTRIAVRVADGGHNVPEDKVISRYYKALDLLPELISVCDVFHLYDNTKEPSRIFKKRKDEYFFSANRFWKEEAIAKLTGISLP